MSDDFIRVYEQHLPDVYGYLAYRLRSRVEAERLTEATFERALETWTTFTSGRLSARLWLLTIARDVARSGLGATVTPGDMGVAPDLGRALSRLERDERSVLAMRFGGGLEPADVATVLELSPTRVEQLLSRGIRRVRTELDRASGRVETASGERESAGGGEGESDRQQSET